MTCGHWEQDHYCGASGCRLYVVGHRCPSHTPARLAGRPEAVPDPALTLDGIRAAAGIVYSFRTTDTALNDQRAIASGKRRSTPQQYRDARRNT